MELITRNLGTKIPGLEWQPYDLFTVGNESFRVTIGGDTSNYQGWIEIRFQYRDGSYSGLNRIGGIASETRILELPVPEVLKSGVSFPDRLPWIRQWGKFRLGMTQTSQITVQLEEITGVDNEP